MITCLISFSLFRSYLLIREFVSLRISLVELEEGDESRGSLSLFDPLHDLSFLSLLEDHVLLARSMDREHLHLKRELL